MLTVCAEADAPRPRLAWRASRPPDLVRRHAQPSASISVVAGPDPIDQRLTLLHELAHWLAPVPRVAGAAASAHHDASLLRHRLCPLPTPWRARCRGARPGAARYPSSLAHARRLGVPGAEEAWRDRRSRCVERARRRAPMRVLVPEHRRPARPRRPLDPLRDLRHPGGRARTCAVSAAAPAATCCWESPEPERRQATAAFAEVVDGRRRGGLQGHLDVADAHLRVALQLRRQLLRRAGERGVGVTGSARMVRVGVLGQHHVDARP